MGKSGLPKDGKKRLEKWIAKYDPIKPQLKINNRHSRIPHG